MEDDTKFRVDGCCTAKTGANVIGMLYGIVAFYLLVSSADYAGEVFSLTDEDVRHFLDTAGMSKIAKYNVLGLKTLKVVSTAWAVVNGMTYISSALVVIGVNNGDRRLLLPWILYSIFLLMGYVILMLLVMAVIIAQHGMMGFVVVIAPAVAVLLFWSLFIAVVNKHYSELSHGPPHPGDNLRKSSGATENNGATPASQEVNYLQTLSGRVKELEDS